MTFLRITGKTLPDGNFATVYPFHVTTEGLEDRVICITDTDLRTAFNLIPICAHRANVIVVAAIVLNTHMHTFILARNYEDAWQFIVEYKMSLSKCITNSYGKGKHINIYKNVNSKPILLEDNYHVRNTICYIFKNALDVGATVDGYKWSSFKSIFTKGGMPPGAHSVSLMRYREVRVQFRTDSIPKGVPWKVCLDGMIAPSSFCDWKYAEEAFMGDMDFFLKVLGNVDSRQMDVQMVVNPQKRLSLEELMKVIDSKSRDKYKKDAAELTYEQKIPLVKKVFYSTKSSVPQLARCFGIRKDRLAEILNLEWEAE